MVFSTSPYWLRAGGRANIRIQLSALRAQLIRAVGPPAGSAHGEEEAGHGPHC